VFFVEALSNEGVNNNELTYSFGHTSPTGTLTAGLFRVVSTRVYLDSAPVRDPITGMVLSDTANPTAVLQTEGTDSDYTLSTVLGMQVVTMTPSVVLQPNTALFVVHVVQIPSETSSGLYNTSYLWRRQGNLEGHLGIARFLGGRNREEPAGDRYNNSGTDRSPEVA
jgi:hypothetical protein